MWPCVYHWLSLSFPYWHNRASRVCVGPSCAPTTSKKFLGTIRWGWFLSFHDWVSPTANSLPYKSHISAKLSNHVVLPFQVTSCMRADTILFVFLCPAAFLAHKSHSKHGSWTELVIFWNSVDWGLAFYIHQVKSHPSASLISLRMSTKAIRISSKPLIRFLYSRQV